MRMRMDATDAPRGPLLPAAVQFATGVVEPTNLEGEELLRTLFYWFAHYVTTGDGDAMLTMLDECRESAPPGTTEPSRLLPCGLDRKSVV